jgi:hypothetical protein
MATAARWIRLGPTGPYDLHAACIGLSTSQSGHAAPIVLWARASAAMIGNLFSVAEDHFTFALIAPLRLAPGRRSRWRAWGLAPALATYRQFGVRAYLDEDALCLNGRRIGASGAQAIGGCTVVACSFLPWLPEALDKWVERDLEAAFRERIEAQHGWEFENSWPSTTEHASIADALAAEEADAAR